MTKAALVVAFVLFTRYLDSHEVQTRPPEAEW